MANPIFYHYTTVAGAHAIIRSRRVWLTDYRFLNDKQELKQGYSHFIAALPPNSRDAFESAFRWHDQFNHHCVLSLSKSPKILSQWRAYASDGCGMALGFSEMFLRHSGIELIHCQYESHESYAATLAHRHSALVEETCSARAALRGENDFMNWIHENRQKFYLLVQDLIALKNPAFAEEQEVRAVRCVEVGQAATRVSNQTIIPYVEAPFWQDDEQLSYMGVVLPQIWLGPKCNELNRVGIYAVQLLTCLVERYDCGYA
jgi:hypothetical protein